MSRARALLFLPLPFVLVAAEAVVAQQQAGRPAAAPVAPAPTMMNGMNGMNGGSGGSCCMPNATVALTKPADDQPKTLVLYDLAMKLRTSLAPFLGNGAVAEFTKRVAALQPNSPLAMVFTMHKSLGDALLAVGEIEAAEKQFEMILPMATAAKDMNASRTIARSMAMCWMRLGERQNCLGRHNQNSCLFPLQSATLHINQKKNRRAIQILMKILKTDSSNLASM